MTFAPGVLHSICSDSFARLFQDLPQLKLFVTTRDSTDVDLIETTGGGIEVVFTESK